jgi:hypothetical protein
MSCTVPGAGLFIGFVAVLHFQKHIECRYKHLNPEVVLHKLQAAQRENTVPPGYSLVWRSSPFSKNTSPGQLRTTELELQKLRPNGNTMPKAFIGY